jgi:hypothetical protein
MVPQAGHRRGELTTVMGHDTMTDKANIRDKTLRYSA